jgi:pseudouridine-5'-phosphate glycosidase
MAPAKSTPATLEIREPVAGALATGAPVVALESTVIAHGLPHPLNLETALAMEAAVRTEGAVPATIGVLDGRVTVGLSPAEIERLATADNVLKVSARDLAPAAVSGRPGATTVAATALVAARAGIRLLATGGIGGVHRGGETSLDISADLLEVSRSAVAVVCSGAKAILDLPRTLEVLETVAVPVIGLGTSEFPAFWGRESGLSLEHRVDRPADAARLLAAHWALGMHGIVLANPAPEAHALTRVEIDTLLEAVLDSESVAGASGKAVTPRILAEMAALSGGRTLEANAALLSANARAAGKIAVALSGLVSAATVTTPG